VVAHVSGKRIVIISMYIPDLNSTQTKDKSKEVLTSRLDAIKEIVQQEQLYNPHTEVIVASNSNQHNPL
jgi:hypothetical protein